MLEKEQVINILEHYKKTSERVNIKFGYEVLTEENLVEGTIRVNIESMNPAIFTVNGNQIMFGQNININFRQFRTSTDMIGTLNSMIFNMVEMLIWQKEGNITTGTKSLLGDESIKANKKD